MRSLKHPFFAPLESGTGIYFEPKQMVRLGTLLFILRRWARPTKATSPSKKRAERNTPPCTAPALTAKGMASACSPRLGPTRQVGPLVCPLAVLCPPPCRLTQFNAEPEVVILQATEVAVAPLPAALAAEEDLALTHDADGSQQATAPAAGGISPGDEGTGRGYKQYHRPSLRYLCPAL